MSNKHGLIAVMSMLVAVVMIAGCGKGGSSSSAGGDGSLAASHGDITVDLTKDVKLELVKVEAGTFTMGARDGENDVDENAHQVTLTKDFYIGMTEVTQAQWKAVMGDDNNPSYFKGDDLPVEQVSWADAMAFCKKLNETGKAPEGWKFTLPTEAQWEYAARGGKKSKGFKYSGSGSLDDVAWYDGNSDRNTYPVAQKKANELGLYDMSGNVLEWCRDWYEYEKDKKYYAADPEFLAGNSGTRRVFRGGSWGARAGICRSATRISRDPGFHNFYIGFRIVLVQDK